MKFQLLGTVSYRESDPVWGRRAIHIIDETFEINLPEEGPMVEQYEGERRAKETIMRYHEKFQGMLQYDLRARLFTLTPSWEVSSDTINGTLRLDWFKP